ncbi:VOC family protein [Robertkochia marina]|uniref:VOC family protein n=1 Tax=Robertkochia marina TaxID=1227945 RepID=A0A4V3UXU8_9FLAO|nr:VOC family protein [Robertkochia marina]THD65730.1 VOC family protein [Robertkochia marina]TRZ46586.1 VOC family protein [Robertkochia marina]
MRPWKLLLLLCLFLDTVRAQPPALSFDHYAIQVEDLNTSVKFYQEILNLQEIKNKTGLEHIRWFSLGNALSLHIIEAPGFKNPPEKGIHLALNTKDLDAIVKHLRSRDIYFENWQGDANTTNTRADGIRQIYLKDPDGYWIEINENE